MNDGGTGGEAQSSGWDQRASVGPGIPSAIGGPTSCRSGLGMQAACPSRRWMQDETAPSGGQISWMRPGPSTPLHPLCRLPECTAPLGMTHQWVMGGHAATDHRRVVGAALAAADGGRRGSHGTRQAGGAVAYIVRPRAASPGMPGSQMAEGGGWRSGLDAPPSGELPESGTCDVIHTM